MRPYKIGDTWVDLDHVLAVGEIVAKTYYANGTDFYDVYFPITLAFRDGEKTLGFYFPWDTEPDFDIEEQKEKAIDQYNDFLREWKQEDYD